MTVTGARPEASEAPAGGEGAMDRLRRWLADMVRREE